MLTDITRQLDNILATAAALFVPSGFFPVPKNTATEFSATDYGYNTHYVGLPNGVRLAYIDEGVSEGAETIIFLHGLGSYLQAWTFMPRLSSNCATH
jgi:hypothetical protein